MTATNPRSWARQWRRGTADEVVVDCAALAAGFFFDAGRTDGLTLIDGAGRDLCAVRDEGLIVNPISLGPLSLHNSINQRDGRRCTGRLQHGDRLDRSRLAVVSLLSENCETWSRRVTTAPETEQTMRKREIEDRVLQEWAELATAWGVSPVLGRIHGLLILSGQPMTAEEICERLQISRASASVQLNAILDWGLARRLFVPGDRRQYYQGDQDHWSWFRRAAIVRKRREFDPVVDRLGEALEASRAAAADDPELLGFSDRLASLHRFVSELFRGVGLVLEEEEALLHYLLSLSPQDLDELREILRLALGRADDIAANNASQNGEK